MEPSSRTEEPGGRLLAERVHLHSSALIRLPFIEAAFLGALSILLRPFVPWPAFLAWGGIVLAISCSRAALAIYVRRGAWHSAPKRQNLIFNMLAWCSGASYGAGAATLFPYLPDENLYLFVGIVAALPAIGLLITRATRRSLLGYAILILVPLGLAWIQKYPEHDTITPVLILFYLAGITLAIRNTETVLRHVSEANQRKNGLVRELGAIHHEVSAAMARAQRSADTRTRVLASASHDLRQPLHALATYAAVLEADYRRETVEHVGRQVDQIIHSLSALLHQLLELSQLIAGQVNLSSQTFSVSEVVREVCEEFRPRIQTHALAFLTDISEAEIDGDPDAVRTITRALLDNALRFTHKGLVRVELTLDGAQRACILKVSDTGVGIDPVHHEQIFEEYFQVGNLARDRQKGVGLGLSIAQRLCALMGTRLVVTSSLGAGSLFEVALPLSLEHEPDRKTEPVRGETLALPAIRPAPSAGHQTSAPARPSLNRTSSDPEVREECVYVHARAIARLPGLHAFVVAGMGSQLTGFFSPVALIIWFVTMLAIDLLRNSFSAWVTGQADAGVSVRRYHGAFTLLSFLTGCALVFGWALQAQNLPPMQLAMSGFPLIIMPPLGVTLAQSSRWIQMAYTLPIVLTITAVGLMSGGAYWPLLPMVTVMLTGLIYIAAIDLEKLVTKAVGLRRELDDMAQKLAARNQDIHRATEQAERASGLRIRALASASHDLRQPLNALSLCNAVLVTGPSSERMAQVINTVRKIVRLLGGLLHNLLDLSRIEAGNPLLSRKKARIDQIISEVCGEFQAEARRKNLSLLMNLEPLEMSTDALAIDRIARNLIDNAIKYSEAGQISVNVRTETHRGMLHAVIEVSDTGCGIPPDRVGHIFDEYVQVSQGSRGKGVGLGLSIVRSLCHLMEGSVDVRSALHRGSIFRVCLPMEAATSKEHENEESRQAGPLKGRRILAVDDDTYVGDSMRLLMTTWGLTCDVAVNAVEAEAYFDQKGPPDLLLLDLRLPGPEHGAQLGKRLLERFGPCPVIVITGETADDSVADALRLGFPVLKKPVMHEVLLKALNDAFNQRAPHWATESK